MTLPDWSSLFSAATLDLSAFTPSAPQRYPASYADQRFAWVGNVPDFPEIPFRVEASAVEGRLVSFEVVGPWQTTTTQSTHAWIIPHLSVAAALLRAMMFLGVVFIAVTHARGARADRRSAMRLAGVTFASYMLSWALGHHSSGPLVELERFFTNVGVGLFRAIVFGAAFIGVEPYVRRYFPQALIGATRLLRGGVWDPAVGRDILIGLTWGTVIAVVALSYPVVPQLLGYPSPAPYRNNLIAVTSPAATIAFAVSFTTPLVNSLAAMVLVALFRRYFSRLWVVILCSAVILTLIDNPALGNFHGHQLQLLGVGFVTTLLTVVVFVRHGFLSGVLANYARYLLAAAFTLDPGRAYFHASVAIAVIILTLGIAGWRMARAHETTVAMGPRRVPSV
jgi:hypothetical protein